MRESCLKIILLIWCIHIFIEIKFVGIAGRNHHWNCVMCDNNERKAKFRQPVANKLK
jgi:hypothetical protein